MSKALTLTYKQTKFVAEFLLDSNGTQAAIRAGYSESGARVTAHRLLTNVAVHGAIQARQATDAIRLSLQREDVLKGLLEAVDQARAQSNPMAMISGLREISRLMGFYAVETKRVELTNAQGAVKANFAVMSDAQLLALITQDAVAA